ncbi:MAG: hypothetical protein ACO1N7_11950 [Sphingobacteriaceae bacterium]
MSKVVTSKTVNIFLALDQKSLAGYFNPHDTSPLYKRQLSLRFEQYIHNSLKSCKRYDPIFFKLNTDNRIDEQFSAPLMYAIRRHYTEKHAEEVDTFNKFKRRNYIIILGSMIIVAILNLLLPHVMSEELAYETGTAHFLDVFSFIIFYHPITELLFNWNPHLKRINMLNKLIKAEVIIVSSNDKVDHLHSHNFEEYDEMHEAVASFRSI